MKLGLKDTITLLSKGYSKKEIDELLAIDESQDKEDKENEEKTPEPKKESDKDPEIDYKVEYEKLKAETDEVKKTLLDLQKKNAKSDISDDLQKKTDEANESLINLVRSYM